jgi:hypothetical protein
MPDNPNTAEPRKPQPCCYKFSLRRLLLAATIAGVSAAIFASFSWTVEEYRAASLWFLGFAVLGVAGGLLFGRPKLGVVVGLVAGFAMMPFTGL